MNREPRDEIVSVRLTKSERARIDELGDPSALRRALDPEPLQRIVPTETGPAVKSWVVWSDGTMGQQWPALETA